LLFAGDQVTLRTDLVRRRTDWLAEGAKKESDAPEVVLAIAHDEPEHVNVAALGHARRHPDSEEQHARPVPDGVCCFELRCWDVRLALVVVVVLLEPVRERKVSCLRSKASLEGKRRTHTKKQTTQAMP